MKKLFLFIIILFSFLLVKGQEELFEGIMSGISKSDYISYCVEKENINITVKETTVCFNNIVYTMEPRFNFLGNLEGLFLHSCVEYNDSTYNSLKDDIIGINEHFRNKYGKEVDFTFSNSSNIQNLIYSISLIYQKESLTCLIYISESIDEFKVFVFIKDYKNYNK